jgi:hypothetical protein
MGEGGLRMVQPPTPVVVPLRPDLLA